MSQTTTAAPDTYLMSQAAPPQNIVLDPNYGSIRMVTPIGRLAFVTLAKPKQVKQPGGTLGNPQFSCTILLNPAACGDLYKAICMVADNRWPAETRPDPANPQSMVQMSGSQLLFVPTRQGGLHYPLREGKENYMRNPKMYEQWNGLFFVNTSIMAESQAGNSQRPITKDESGHDCDPGKFYSGCYGRLHIALFAFPKQGTQGQGSRGVGVSLLAAQFARHGEKFTSFDASKAAADAFAQAGAIPVDTSQQQIGYGPNTGTPGSVPPGGMVPGFAAPPGGVPMQGAPIPPQNPAPGGFAGARPPGV